MASKKHDYKFITEPSDMKKHEDDDNNVHLLLEKMATNHLTLSQLEENNKMLLEKTATFDRSISQLEEKNEMLLKKIATFDHSISQLEENNKTLRDGESIIFKVPGYSSKKRNNEEFYSDHFYTSPGGYKMGIRVHANGFGTGEGTHVSVYACILEGPYDDSLHWPFMGTVTYELLNQLADDNHHSYVFEYKKEENKGVGSTYGHSKFISHSALSHDTASNTQYLMDDTLYFRVTVKVNNHKPWLVCTERMDTNLVKAVKDNITLKEGESLIFKLPGYSRRKAKDSEFYSDSFYTSPGGYKMYIEVYANGNDVAIGTHVTVYTTLLEGPYDDQLHWPFLGTVTYELLNQLTSESHHSKDITYDAKDNLRPGKSIGCLKFISHSELSCNPASNTKYLMDDTLYFRVTVKVNNHKPWLVCTHHTK